MASCHERKPRTRTTWSPAKSSRLANSWSSSTWLAPPRMCTLPEPEHRVAEVADLVLLELERVPAVPDRVEAAGHLVVAAVDGALDGRRARRHPLHVGRQVADAELEVVPVPRLDALTRRSRPSPATSQGAVSRYEPAVRRARDGARSPSPKRGSGCGLAGEHRARRARRPPARACSRGRSHRRAARRARARGAGRTGSCRPRSASSGRRAPSAPARPRAPGSARRGRRRPPRASRPSSAAAGRARSASPSRSEATFIPYGSIRPWP